jgi:hypothetical protein
VNGERGSPRGIIIAADLDGDGIVAWVGVGVGVGRTLRRRGWAHRWRNAALG